MKIETIYFLERKNLGGYEHTEMSATARIDDGENPITAMLTLKDLVHNTLHGTLNKPISKEEVAQEVESEKPKAKRNAKTTKAIDSTTPEKEIVIPEEAEVVTEAPKKKATKITKYSSDIPEHKSIFGAYLAKKYGDTWKTVKPVADIKAFTASLNGNEFLDDVGTVVPSFIDLVHGFFGA